MAVPLIVLAAVWTRPYWGRAPGGPLEAGQDSSSTIGANAEVNQAMTYGFGLGNRGDQPITIERIAFLPEPHERFEIIDVLIAPFGLGPGIGGVHGFLPKEFVPVADQLVPIEGATIPAAPDLPGDYQMLLGARLTEPGWGGFRAMEIDYRVGWRKYRVRTEHGYVICAPPSPSPEGCDPPGFDDLA